MSQTLRISTPSDREIVLTRAFAGPRHLVWQAWTTPELLSQWLLGPEGWTMTVCEIDLRPGGAWRFAWRHADGRDMEMRGACREVVPSIRLVSTESWGGGWPETLNTLELTEENGVTTATQTILYASKETRDAAIATGMTKGVALSFNRLEPLVCKSAA